MLVITLTNITKKCGDKWRTKQNHTLSINDSSLDIEITENDIRKLIKKEYSNIVLLNEKSKIDIITDSKNRSKK